MIVTLIIIAFTENSIPAIRLFWNIIFNPLRPMLPGTIKIIPGRRVIAAGLFLSFAIRLLKIPQVKADKKIERGAER